ncbi:hypothetical protein [Caulobacter sp.]|uniref:hypothetical protein n=1 Tax=Caulobacter sp. TaxID=78 RepID=UPI0031D5255D
MMKSRVRAKKHPFPGGWLVLGILTCAALFWAGVQGGDHLSGGLSTAAMFGAFAALWIGPLLAAITVLWGSFAFFKWLVVGR